MSGILNLKRISTPVKPIGFIPWLSTEFCPIAPGHSYKDSQIILTLSNTAIIKPDDTLFVSGIGIGVDNLYSVDEVDLTIGNRNSGQLKITLPGQENMAKLTVPDWLGAIKLLRGDRFEEASVSPRVYRIQQYPVYDLDAFPTAAALRWADANERQESHRKIYNAAFEETSNKPLAERGAVRLEFLYSTAKLIEALLQLPEDHAWRPFIYHHSIEEVIFDVYSEIVSIMSAPTGKPAEDPPPPSEAEVATPQAEPSAEPS